MSLFTVQTTANREPDVADDINDNTPGVHAVLAPADTKGYVFVEADTHDTVQQAVRDIPSAQRVLDGETSMQEVAHFLSPRSDVDKLREGIHVEITSGPYEGDTATIQTINKVDEEITVELDDAPVPIPIALRGDQVRPLDTQ